MLVLFDFNRLFTLRDKMIFKSLTEFSRKLEGNCAVCSHSSVFRDEQCKQEAKHEEVARSCIRLSSMFAVLDYSSDYRDHRGKWRWKML